MAQDERARQALLARLREQMAEFDEKPPRAPKAAEEEEEETPRIVDVTDGTGEGEGTGDGDGGGGGVEEGGGEEEDPYAASARLKGEMLSLADDFDARTKQHGVWNTHSTVPPRGFLHRRGTPPPSPLPRLDRAV